MNSASDSDEYEAISYVTVCEELEDIINGDKLPKECNVAIQEKHNKPAKHVLELHSSVIEILSKVTPLAMKDAQQSDPTSGQEVQCVKGGNKPKLSQIWKVKSKNVRKYLLSIWLFGIFKRGTLQGIWNSWVQVPPIGSAINL